MELPNIYENKNYKYYLAVPLLLMFISLGIIYFNGIPQGLDLKGGMILTIETAQPVDAAALQSEIQLISPDAEVRSFSGGGTQGVEIQTSLEDNLAGAEQEMSALYQKNDAFVEATVNLTYANSDPNMTEAQKAEYASKELSARTDLVNYANSLLEKLGSAKRVSLADASSAEKTVQGEFDAQKDASKQKILDVVSKRVQVKSYSFKEVGPLLSKFFLAKTQEIILYSFVISAIVVLLVFRSVVPSFAVIFGAVNDIIIALGLMSLFNVPLSLASVAALLMLIGYSLDTDIMLTIKVLQKGSGDPKKNVHDAFKTGLMMSATSFAAFFVLFVIASILRIPTYYQIAAVGMFGLLGDVFTTWLNNAVLILWHVEGKRARD